MGETHHYLGESGGMWAYDLPLHETIQEKVAKGYLRRVNPDGSPWSAPAPEDGSAPPAERRPSQSAPKVEWIGYAVRAHGADPGEADGMTKPDLIEKYGRDG